MERTGAAQPVAGRRTGFNHGLLGRLRDECPNTSWFEGQQVLDDWVRDYNEVRPHSALDKHIKIGSSEESVSDRRLGQGSKAVIEGDLGRFEGP